MKLILSLDTGDAQRASLVLDQTKSMISHVKLGHIPFSMEPDTIKEMIQDIPLFLDFKLHDIPSTMARAITGYRNTFENLKMITVWGTSSSDGLKAVVESCDNQCQPLSVISLTSDIGDVNTFLKTVELNLNCGINGFITPSFMLKEMRKYFGQDITLVTPGVRFENKDDHQNCITPQQALKQGCDYMVVGRPIMNAQNIKQQTQLFHQFCKP
ncbi:orotidine-5'-phosphate decarboxylase [Phocoenobacter skyensis]|uniref:Orotidine 5'-phosphate decarboxylase n=1 Tax=Phocoenobacter skyensis TaxID=97481 RepID=A0A1H7XQV1_9PAST|nr:orotidine-5'-phosphate decarboxylase [Pasteurella skyensis]MDP8184471.1 orotidine-5'-phosphate decarboxylase [Pasteurella skyensis]QLB23263.1 orotidine 5'-phosphate decarboxylase [Pasteurella skyensis]SEM36216.1 orotidine-5'-phosphate decarboxylase [Pasteurella skyensis]